MMNQGLAALCVLVFGMHAASTARADVRPELAHTALAAIEEAKTVAKAGRGQLLLVGSTLSTEQVPSENVVAVLDYPILRDLKPGAVLIFAKNGCEPVESCLIARRVTGIDVKGEVQTDPYTMEGLLFAGTKATLLGSVAYAIDLETGSIRDMRADRAQESVTLPQAVAEEEARTRAKAS
jgi:hypothetical protein